MKYKHFLALAVLALSILALGACELRQEETNPTYSADELMSIVTTVSDAYSNNQLESARDILSEIDEDRLDEEGRRIVASAYKQLSMPQSASDILQPALTLESSPYTQVLAAAIYEDLQNHALTDHWLGIASGSNEARGTQIELAYPEWLMGRGQYLDAYFWLRQRVNEPSPGLELTQTYIRAALYSKNETEAESYLHDSQTLPEKNWMLGILYNATGEYAKSLGVLSDSVAEGIQTETKRVGLIELFGNLAPRFAADGEYSAAEASADYLLELDPESFKWAEYRVRLSLNQKEFDTASALVDSWTQFGVAEKSSMLGDIALAKAELEAAFEHYLLAWEARPQIGLANKLVVLNQNLGAEDPLKEIRQWTADETDNPEAWLALAVSARGLGEEEEAIAAYEQLIRIDSQNWVAHNNIAMIYGEQKEYDKALSHAQVASEINPESASVLDTLAWTYYLYGDLDQARSWSQKALDMDPGNTQIRDNYRKIRTGS